MKRIAYVIRWVARWCIVWPLMAWANTNAWILWVVIRNHPGLRELVLNRAGQDFARNPALVATFREILPEEFLVAIHQRVARKGDGA